MVPLLDINAQNSALEQELTGAFQRVFRSGQFILGPEVAALEAEIAELCEVPEGIGVSSGTDAILLALMALEVGPGDEVLCPAFTFFATAGCVSRVGARPVFVDVDPVTYNIDIEDAEKKLTSRTKAIIPVHLFGQCADMEAIGRLAEHAGLAVIEDAAQSLGARCSNHPAGSMGVFGAFSFYPTKNLGGLGDGGMLMCRDANLGRKARALRSHGAERTYEHRWVGGNFRLDALQAAFLRAKLPSYEDYTRRRRANARYYTEELRKLPKVALTAEPSNNQSAEILLPVEATHREHIWNQYTIRVRGTRDILKTHLQERGIGSGIYYPIPLNEQECFASLRQQGSCPVSASLAGEVLSLPVYPELTGTQLEKVVTAISEFLH